MIELLVFIAFAAVIVLYSRIGKLDRRVRHMESYLQKVSSSGATPRPVATGGEVEEPIPHGDVKDVLGTNIQTLPEDIAQSLEQKSAMAHEPHVVEQFIDWLRTDWLMKLGGFLIILGVGWFVSYAFANNWIGDMGKISLGLAAGAGVLVLGRYRIVAYVTQGSVLMFLGAVVVMLTMYAARELYDFFTPLSALVIMFLTTVVLGVTSVQFARRSLAYGNILLAAIVPLLTTGSLPTIGVFFTYLLVLAAGSLWVAWVTGWRELVLLSLAITWLYSFTFVERISYGRFANASDADTGLMFAFIFTMLFFLSTVVGMLVQQKVYTRDLVTALASGGFLLYWVLSAAAPEWQSMILIAWTVVFAVGAFLAVRLGAAQSFFYSYAGVGVVLLGVATALELDGPALTIAAIIEAALVLFLGYRITGKAHTLPILAIPSAIPLLLSFGSLEPHNWRDGIWHQDAAVLLLIIVVTAGFGAYFHGRRLNASEADRQILVQVRMVASVLSGLYGMAFTWLAVHALVENQDTATMVTLLIYTLVASVLFMLGKQTGLAWQRLVARALIVFVVGRLLIIDVWQMELTGRIITFLLIGTVLIIVAWVERSAIREKVHAEE